MYIRDVMTADVVTVSSQQSLADALKLILEKRISFIVVADERRPVGVLTEGDIVRLARDDCHAEHEPVANFMSSPVVTVQADLNIFHAYDEIINRRIRHIVVVNQHQELAGVMTMSNFLASMGVEHLARLRHVAEEASTDIETVTPDTPMSEIVAAMHRCNHAMVALEDGIPVGILTSRDITRLYHQERAQFHQRCMRDYMRTPVLTLPRSAYIPEANNLMRRHKTRHIVVVDNDGVFFGLLTISDVVHSMENKYIAFMKAVMREMERDLRIRSVQQTALFERNPNAVFSLDTNGVIKAINPACVLLTGLGEDGLIDLPLRTFINDKDHLAYERARAEALRGEACSLHVHLDSHTSEASFVFLNLVPVIVDDKHAGLYAVAHDVTESTQAERHLRLLSSALEQANEAIIIINEAGCIEFANLSFAQTFAAQADSLPGRPLDQLLTVSCCKNAAALWQQVAQCGRDQYYAEVFLQNGTTLEAKISLSSFTIEQEHTSHLIIVIEDMRERRAIEAQLRQAQKMEALGTLVGGIAHDFNNLLASISGNLFLIREEIAERVETAKKVEVLENECFRAAGLIQQLLVFARKGNVKKERLDLCQLLRDTMELGRVALYEQIQLLVDIPRLPLEVFGNSQQLQQVVLNLINNAADAVKYKISPRIEVVLSHDETASDEMPYGCVRLTVRDNGCGIQSKDLPHIFEPFFTTKEVGQGSGLGLSMAYGAIEQHGGVLSVQSQFAHGATFSVVLPYLPAEHGMSLLDSVQPHYILVADDEPRMRDMCRALLESRHYRVLVADSGEQALARVEEYGDAIDLVVLDVMMPGLTGVDVWSRLVTMMPGLPVLLMTGYDRQNVSKGLPDYVRDAHVLKKPFYPADFLARVKEMIGGDIE